jgi:hypothetical protein
LAAVCLILGLGLAMGRPLQAAWWADSAQGTSSGTTQREAIRSIPIGKLDAASRAKVASVLDNVTLYRRMPIRAVPCDPDLHLFLVRHPDVIVNIWEVLGVAQLQLRQTGPEEFQVEEKEGTSATMQFLYHTRDTHLVYGEWKYTGKVLPRTIGGRCLAILHSGCVHDSDGSCCISNRLDAFVSVEPGGVELLSKIFYPLIAKTADSNFLQTVSFVGSLSRTAEVNSRGVQRLAGKLTHVQPEVRRQFAGVAAAVARKASEQGTAAALTASASNGPDSR